MVDNLSVATHGLPKRILTSLSVDEISLLRYINLSTNFKDLPFNGDMGPS